MEERKVIYVDHVAQAGGITFGRSESLALSQKNLFKIYGLDLLDKFRDETYRNGIFRFFDKYCQFIFSAQTFVIPQFCIILTFIDCDKNVDAALEFYSSEDSDLKIDEKTKFMELFNEIDNLPTSEFATLEIVKF